MNDWITPVTAASPARTRWLLFGVLVFLVLLNVQYLFKVSAARDSRSAFVRWTPQLAELARGTDIWRKHNYPNPPIMALVLSPFAQLPGNLGAIAWFYFKIGLTIAAIWGVFSMLERPEYPFPFWGKALAVILSVRPIQGDLTHGNVNLFILFLVVAALVAFTRHRDFCAGLALALAIACKVTPALFIPYFLWKRAWRTVAATTIGLLIFLFVIPGCWFGWEQNWTYLQSWHQVMVQPFVVEGMVTSEHQNQSLPGLAARLLTHAPSFATYDGPTYVPVEYHNLLDLDRATAAWIVKGCMAAFAGLLMWRCRTPLGDRRNWKLVAEYSIVALGMLLFSERTWKHHAVTLLLPFAVLAYVVAALSISRPQRWAIMSILGLSSLLMLSTSTGFWDVHDAIGKTAQVYGAYAWACFLLAGLLFVALGWRNPPRASEPVEVLTARKRLHTLELRQRSAMDV